MRENNKYFNIIFLLILVSVSLVYNYIYISQFGPSSVHFWRQSDSASIAMNYFHNGLSFFNPKVHALVSGDSAAASEFPVTYYLAAIFYKLFGPHDYILRIIDLLIYYAGVYFLAKLLRDYYKNDLVLIFSVVLMVLGMPILAFYSYNFIPNTPALGFLFIGTYFYYKYRVNNKESSFYPMIIFFALAGLIKPTMLILFLSIVFIEFVATILNINKHFSLKKILVFFLGVVIPVGLWIIWVKHYNEIHNSGIFSTSIVPFTMLKMKDLNFALHNISTGFDQRVFPYVVMKILFAIIVFNLLYFIRRFDLFSVFYFIFFVGNISFLLLWMKRFTVHDYYTIDILPFYIFNISFFIHLVFNTINNKKIKTGIGLLLLIYGIYSVYFSGEYIKEKFFNRDMVTLDYPKVFQYNRQELKDFLKKHNLLFGRTKIAAYPDNSPNCSLYHLDIRGRTFEKSFNKFYYFKDVYNDSGLEYLIILNKNVLKNKKLRQYLAYPVDSLNNEIFVYDIKKLATKK